MSFNVVSKKSGKTYHLHIRESKSAEGKVSRRFYFSGDGTGAADALPDGYIVVESERTGLPFLKKNV